MARAHKRRHALNIGNELDLPFSKPRILARLSLRWSIFLPKLQRPSPPTKSRYHPSRLQNGDCLRNFHVASKINMPMWLIHEIIRNFNKCLINHKGIPWQNINWLDCADIAEGVRLLHFCANVCIHTRSCEVSVLETPTLPLRSNVFDGLHVCNTWANSNTTKRCIRTRNRRAPGSFEICKTNAKQASYDPGFRCSWLPKSRPVPVWVLHKIIETAHATQKLPPQ